MPNISLLVLVVVAIATVPLVVHFSVRRWVSWAQRAADYAATDILNANYIDSDEAVARLRSQFDAWSIVVKEGTARFCRVIDAHRIQFVDAPPSVSVSGFNEEHQYIRQITAERVQRLLDLAARLQDGETRLRNYWVPRLSD